MAKGKTNNNERDRLLYTVNRFDHYFESVNNKTAVYLAMNTFILGGIITGYISFQDYVIHCRDLFNILLISQMFLGVAALLIVTNASTPYFSKRSDSLYYFGGIGSLTKENFDLCSKKSDTNSDMTDLRNQVHVLSVGLTSKFKKLRVSGWLIFSQFLLLIPIIIILIKNQL
jgi:hypothetical protein